MTTTESAQAYHFPQSDLVKRFCDTDAGLTCMLHAVASPGLIGARGHKKFYWIGNHMESYVRVCAAPK